jgi:hypothetical protein
MEHRSLAPDLVVSDDNDACGNQCSEELAPNVAQEELREEKQMGGPVNCSDSELSIYLQALAEGFLATYYSDTSPSVQSKSMSIASKSYQRGKKMVVFHGFPSFQMSRNSTGQDGMDWSIASLVAFRARTFQSPVPATALTEKEADSGWKWPGSLVKYDRASRSWKTRQLSLLGDCTEFSETWPRWGSMQSGECFPLRMLEHDTSANASGSWPTPCKTDGMKACCKTTMERKERGESRPSGAKIGSSLMWFRPSVDRWTKDGWLSPNMHELLMIWPPSWTDLRPLETDKFQQWLRWHGGF